LPPFRCPSSELADLRVTSRLTEATVSLPLIGDPSLEWAICPVTLRGNCLAALHRAKPAGWLELAEVPGPAHGVNRQSDLATGGATVLQEERDRAWVQLMPGVPACTGAVSRAHNRFTLGVAPRPFSSCL
jgi:hypothetical protein